MKQNLIIIGTTILTALAGQALADTCVTQTMATHTCREFTSKVSYGDNREFDGTPGVACLQADNSWLVISGPGYGSAFYRNDNQAIAYPVSPFEANSGTALPTKIRYIVSRNPVCVPSLPVFLQHPANSYPYHPHNPYHYHQGQRFKPLPDPRRDPAPQTDNTVPNHP